MYLTPERAKALQEAAAKRAQRPGDDPVLSAGEVAKLMRVDPKTINRYAKAGLLPYFRTLGGHMRFHQSEVRAAMHRAVEGDNR